MYSKLMLASVLSLGLAASPGAMARSSGDDDRPWDRNPSSQDGRHGDDRDPRYQQRFQDRDDHRDSRGWSHDRRESARYYGHDGDGREHNRDRGGWRHGSARYSHYDPPRGYQRHQWHRGDYVPTSYRSHRYVVEDYRSYRLAAPPRGHAWVRVDHDVVLTAIATGVVAAVAFGVFQ